MSNTNSYSKQTRDDVLDFYGYLFDDMLEDFVTSEESEEQSEEIKRIKIFRTALDTGMSTDEVSAKLESEKLRGIYERNPVELVLKFCFDSNGNPNSFRKYDYKGFLTLWKSLGYKKTHSAPEIGCETVGKQKVLTLAKLREYVLTASKPSVGGISAKTASVTLNIKNQSNELDLTSPEAENKLGELLSELSESLSDACESARFYFAKYAYYTVCHQITELIELLRSYSDMTPEQALNMVGARGAEAYSGSVLAGVYTDIEIEEFLYGENDSKQLGKELLRAALNNLALRGTSAYRENISPLFQSFKDGKYLALSEALREKTVIFAHGSDAKKHTETKEAIDKLKISDFYGFALDLGKLYELLFASLLPYAEESTKEYGKKYVAGILEGKYDMSRSATMLYLLAVKASLFNVSALIDDPDSPFDKDSVLTLTRVNEVLDRMGYVNVGDNDSSAEESALDNLYYELFTAENDSGAVLEALRGRLEEFSDTYGYNPLPFEIAHISAKERAKIILTEKK